MGAAYSSSSCCLLPAQPRMLEKNTATLLPRIAAKLIIALPHRAFPILRVFLRRAAHPGTAAAFTASGERFNMHALTAAHRTLPLLSYVRVTNLANGKSVVVKINDRGPFSRRRVIDLSYAAAKSIGLRRRGVGRVKIQGIARP